MTLVMAVIFSFTVSCTAIQNSNKTQRGAGIGVAAGALVGGLIGGDIGGALIGAAIGGAAGGLIGNQMDKQADKISEAVPGAEVRRVGEGIYIIFDEKSGVNFDFDSDRLTNVAKENLNAVAEIFNEFPDTDLMIEGHTDNVGSDDYNMNLSKRRADAVVNYIKSKGVSGNRISVKAYGETAPRFKNDSEVNRAKNRRVEIGVSANKQMIEDAKAQEN